MNTNVWVLYVIRAELYLRLFSPLVVTIDVVVAVAIGSSAHY